VTYNAPMHRIPIRDHGAARLRAGQVWIWRTDVAPAAEPPPEPGPVAVCDGRGRVLGAALWAVRSPVALRMYALGETPPVWDTAWLGARLAAAAARRRALYGPNADAYRVVHAEADDVPGLLVDRYGDVAVVQTTSEAMDRSIDAVVGQLREVLPVRAVVVRDDGATRDFEVLPRRPPRLAFGSDGHAEFHEGELTLAVDALLDAKTGSFLDQRENHLHAAGYARSARRVLDAFCYHGGFGLQMVRAGAREALLYDENASAVGRARDNAERASLAGRVRVEQRNAFDELRRLEAAGERFDVVVLDPPALAKRKGPEQAAERAYRELNLRALRLLEPEGLLVTSSCSARLSPARFGELVGQAAAGARRTVQILERRGAGRDHPERAGVPETAYLKCWICRVL
jgi:23S rRNA (cytosine1962-C5)-methyltransferase